MLFTLFFAWIRFDVMAGIIAAGGGRDNVGPGGIAEFELVTRVNRGGVPAQLPPVTIRQGSHPPGPPRSSSVQIF